MTSTRPAFGLPEDLTRKLGFTLLALLIYRVGAHIVAPGVNVQAISDFIKTSSAAGLFNLYDTLGGGLSRATVFALGIMPYISASIIFQLAGGIVPSVGKMQKEEEGRKKLTQWTRYITIMIAVSQAWTFALFTESIPNAVPVATLWTRLTMVVVLTTGAIFVMWLGEQITERGIGNGMSLMITFSILDRLWPGAAHMYEFWTQGSYTVGRIVFYLLILVGVVGAVTGMSLAARRIPVQIPRKVVGRGRMTQGQKTFIPIALITAGVMPIVFAQTIMIVPLTVASFTQVGWVRSIADVFAVGELPYDLTFFILILLFSYFYTSIG
jgi:preprotein translocase subunit SecY